MKTLAYYDLTNESPEERLLSRGAEASSKTSHSVLQSHKAGIYILKTRQIIDIKQNKMTTLNEKMNMLTDYRADLYNTNNEETRLKMGRIIKTMADEHGIKPRLLFGKGNVKAQRARYRKRVIEEKRFQCKKCERVFTSGSSLKNHTIKKVCENRCTAITVRDMGIIPFKAKPHKDIKQKTMANDNLTKLREAANEDWKWIQEHIWTTVFSDLPSEISQSNSLLNPVLGVNTLRVCIEDDEKTIMPDSEQKIRPTNLDEFFNKCLKDDPYQTLHAEPEEKDAEHINICLKEELE